METTKNIIQKVKVKDGQLETVYEEYFPEENYSNTITKKCSQIIHSDFREALDKLKIHLVAICEMPEVEMLKQADIYSIDPDLLNNYIVTGYSHGGNDDSEGVVIVGQKLLKTGKVLNMITPFVKFHEESDDGYLYAGELHSEIMSCDHEAAEYLFNEKFGMKQMSLDFDAPVEANVTITGIETSDDQKPKKSRKKKKVEEIKSFDVYA